MGPVAPPALTAPATPATPPAAVIQAPPAPAPVAAVPTAVASTDPIDDRSDTPTPAGHSAAINASASGSLI